MNGVPINKPDSPASSENELNTAETAGVDAFKEMDNAYRLEKESRPKGLPRISGRTRFIGAEKTADSNTIRKLEIEKAREASALPRFVRHSLSKKEIAEKGMIESGMGSHLFFDLTNYTGKSKLADAIYGEESGKYIHEWIDQVIVEAVSVMKAFGGDVVLFAGDAIQVMFEGENHQIRAGMAALFLQKKMASMPDIQTVPIQPNRSIGEFLVEPQDITREFRKETRSKELIINTIENDMAMTPSTNENERTISVKDTLSTDDPESFTDEYIVSVSTKALKDGVFVREYRLPDKPNYVREDTLKFACQKVLAKYTPGQNGQSNKSILREKILAIPQEGSIGIATGSESKPHFKVIIPSKEKDKNGEAERFIYFTAGPAISEMAEVEKGAKANQVHINHEAYEALKDIPFFSFKELEKEGTIRYEVTFKSSSNEGEQILLATSIKTKAGELSLCDIYTELEHEQTTTPTDMGRFDKCFEKTMLKRIRDNADTRFEESIAMFIQIPSIAEMECDDTLNDKEKYEHYKQVWHIIYSAVASHGGVVNKLNLSNNNLIIFGLDPKDDDGDRAYECAKEIQLALAKIGHPAFIGLKFDKNLCGIVGDKINDNSKLQDLVMLMFAEATIMGNGVNLAAREAAALMKNPKYKETGAVGGFVDYEIRRLREYTLGLIREVITIKGQPGVHEMLVSVGPLERKAHPENILGRDAEVTLIQEILKCSGNKCVEITGEYGVGKSCLLHKARRLAQQEANNPVIHVVCEQKNNKKGLNLWTSIIKELFKDDLIDGGKEIQSILSSSHNEDIIPIVLDALKNGTEGNGEFIRDGFHKLMRAKLNEKSMVITVDDFHNADEASMDFMEMTIKENGPHALKLFYASKTTHDKLSSEKLSLTGINQKYLISIALKGFNFIDGNETNSAANPYANISFIEALWGKSKGNPRKAREIILSELKKKEGLLVKTNQNGHDCIAIHQNHIANGTEQYFDLFSDVERVNILDGYNKEEQNMAFLVIHFEGEFTVNDVIKIAQIPDNQFPGRQHPLKDMKDEALIEELLESLASNGTKTPILKKLDGSGNAKYVVFEQYAKEEVGNKAEGGTNDTAIIEHGNNGAQSTRMIAESCTASEKHHLAHAWILDTQIKNLDEQMKKLQEEKKFDDATTLRKVSSYDDIMEKAAYHFHKTAKGLDNHTPLLQDIRTKAREYNMTVGKRLAAARSGRSEEFFKRVTENYVEGDEELQKAVLMQMAIAFYSGGKLNEAKVIFQKLVTIANISENKA
jgi:class 3 adenylate cyclase